jgi:acetylornithine deacetylase/succinyl-diaminopimelate desuccinylase-like protein
MLTVVLAIAGLIVFYLIVRVMIEQSNARLREEFRLATESVATRVKRGAATEVPREAPACEGSSDMVSAIAAATAVVGGRKVKVRPSKTQSVRVGEDIWAQHGRAGVWSSHDIAQRWR